MVEKRAVLEKSREIRKKRRRIIWLSVTAVLVLLIVFYSLFSFTDIFIGSSAKTITSAPGQPESWAMFHRDLSRTGLSGTSQAAPAGKIKWTFTAGTIIHSSPAVVDGVVYFGSRDQHLYAVDAATGEQLWAFSTGSWVESSPAVVDGVVYFGSNDSILYAVDAKTGREIWRFAVKYAIRSSPAVANGVVYIGTDDYAVYAVDAATGKMKWSKKTDNLVLSAPAVNLGIVAVGCSDGIFYTFNANNGRPRLQFDTFSTVTSSPAVQDKYAYFADNRGWFYAIDITRKNWLWENKLRQYWNALYLYGVAPKPSPPSGLLWNIPLYTGFFGVNTVSSPVLVDNTAYLGVGNDVVSVDLTAHKVGWTFHTNGAVTSSPVSVGNEIIFGSQDGRVYSVNKDTGEKLWDVQLGAATTSSAAVYNGVLFIGCDDGMLYAIE